MFICSLADYKALQCTTSYCTGTGLNGSGYKWDGVETFSLTVLKLLTALCEMTLFKGDCLISVILWQQQQQNKNKHRKLHAWDAGMWYTYSCYWIQQFVAVLDDHNLHSGSQWHEIAQAFAMVDCKREMIAKESCRCGEYRLFEHLLFLFLYFAQMWATFQSFYIKAEPATAFLHWCIAYCMLVCSSTGTSMERQSGPSVHWAAEGIPDTPHPGGASDGDGDDPHWQASTLTTHPGGARQPSQRGPFVSHVLQLLLH